MTPGALREHAPAASPLLYPRRKRRPRKITATNSISAPPPERFSPASQAHPLGTDLFAFYGQLGWHVWRGPTGVRTDRGVVRIPDEDGFVMVRRTPATPELDLEGMLTCDWRPGDVW